MIPPRMLRPGPPRKLGRRPARAGDRPHGPHLAAVVVVAAAAVGATGCGANPRVGRSTIPATVTAPDAGGAGRLPASAAGNYTGADVPNQFGDVQVEVAVRRGRIVDVLGLKLPSDRARSRYISAQAAPILRAEVLAAQSGTIDLVSGATYTSDGWANSVQSALTQVR
jgi:uncharacterized protein with FMN-binding domain